MNPLLAIDTFLIGRVFEPFAQYVERTVGINCFGLARLCAVIGTLAWWVANGCTSPPGYLLFLFLMLVVAYALEFFAKRERASPGACYMNELKTEEYAAPRVLLFSAVVFFLVVVGVTAALGTLEGLPVVRFLGMVTAVLSALCYVYFMACDILPPGTISKLRTFTDSLKASRAATGDAGA